MAPTDDYDYKGLFEKSPFARLLMKVEPGGGCVYATVNAAASGYFDMLKDNMIGKTAAQIFDGTTAELWDQSCFVCIKGKRPVTVNAMPRIHGGVKMQAFVLTPILDETGEVAFIDIMARPELTDSAQLQRERDDAIMLLTSVFDASGVGIIVTDDMGHIVRVNDSFLGDYGWRRDDLLGEEFTRLVPHEDHDVSRKMHMAFIERGKQGSRELQLLRKDGSIADIILTTAMLELSQGRRFMISTVRDITERKNMMRNLRKAKEDADSANVAKSAFLANMSHELRTPLNAIIGFSELIMHETFGAVGSPKYTEYLTDIHFSARHLLDIINDVLDMSKIEAGKVELVESEVSITEVFESVERIMGERARTASVILTFDIEPALPHIRADHRFLRQILINLVSNAVKFSAAQKTVKVSARMLPDNHLRMAVEDEGCGIPADKIQTVLEPFGQAYDPRYYKGQGTGLGLPLAKAMVELHNGKLTLESTVDIGTRVFLDLPVERTMRARDAIRNKASKS